MWYKIEGLLSSCVVSVDGSFDGCHGNGSQELIKNTEKSAFL